jgi:hypothetical protein
VNARTLIITAGAIVALAAPTVANAKMLPAKQPTKHAVKKHVTKPNVTKPNVTKGGGKGKAGPTISVYPATVIPATTSLEQIQQDYNNDLLAHGLDAIDFGGAGTPASAPETASTDAAPQAADASLAAAAATTASETVNGTGWDDLYLDC